MGLFIGRSFRACFSPSGCARMSRLVLISSTPAGKIYIPRQNYGNNDFGHKLCVRDVRSSLHDTSEGRRSYVELLKTHHEKLGVGVRLHAHGSGRTLSVIDGDAGRVAGANSQLVPEQPARVHRVKETAADLQVRRHGCMEFMTRWNRLLAGDIDALLSVMCHDYEQDLKDQSRSVRSPDERCAE
eukprot:271044-Hanusia_phi.AAC.2